VAGRNKQPLSIIQGKGRSNHLTKKVIKERQEQEDALKGNTDNIVAPGYLIKRQKEEFESLSKELVRLNIFSNLDVDGLARYIDSRDEYIKVVKELRDMKSTDIDVVTRKPISNEDYAKLVRVKNTLFNECKSSSSELGLSITSRLKLVIPKKEEKPKTDFEKKFGDL